MIVENLAVVVARPYRSDVESSLDQNPLQAPRRFIDGLRPALDGESNDACRRACRVRDRELIGDQVANAHVGELAHDADDPEANVVPVDVHAELAPHAQAWLGLR